MCILSSSLEEVSEWGNHLTLNKLKDLEITQGFVSLEHEKIGLQIASSLFLSVFLYKICHNLHRE